MMKSILLFILFLPMLAQSQSHIYISPSGKDTNPGTEQSPKASLSAAVRQARELRRLNDTSTLRGVTIHVSAGEYEVYEPVYIRPEDSGNPLSPTLIKGEKGAVISGGVHITNWKKEGKFLVADVPDFNGRPLDFRQLWINGQKATRARDVEDFSKMFRIKNVDNKNQKIWVPAEAVKKIAKAPYAEMVLHEMWCVANLRIKSIEFSGDSAAVSFHNPESKIQFEHPWPRPMVTTNGHNSAFYLTNAMELLDLPGEWFHDIRTHKLYYYPRKGETVSDAVVPAVETLVQVEGTTDCPVEYVTFENVTFAYSTWMRPSLCGHVPLQAGMYLTEAYQLSPKMQRNYRNVEIDNQGWLGRAAAAVTVEGGNNINFQRCTFRNIGFTALDYISGTNGGKVEGCLFTDIAGNGLVAGSFSPASFETHKAYDPSDQRDICSFLSIENNRFRDVTNEDWGCLGICAGYVRDITIAHNEISEVSYTGISLGWGWTQSVNCMRHNEVYGNLIYHYAKHMYDVSGIYTLGAQPKSYVFDNVIHSIYSPEYAHDPEHWFYLYTDEGSSFITIENNWTESEKFLQNSNGPGNVWNNNGPMVNDSIREAAGLLPEFKRLLDNK